MISFLALRRCRRFLPRVLTPYVAGAIWCVGLAMFALSLSSAEDVAPKTYKGRVIAPPMSYRGADWLERSDRDATQQPEKVLDELAIKPGSAVADIGAG